MIKRCVLLFTVLAVAQLSLVADLKKDAEQALERGVKFFHSISTEGGYVYFVTPDLSERWGEGPADEQTIEVQPPGTPAVGLAFVRAYDATQYNGAMRAAKDAANALIRGQNDLGGWGHVIHFDKPKSTQVSFDDDQTQTAISFLMALDQKVGDDSLWGAIEKSLNLMVKSQLPNGGWPHQYPPQGNYHDYATFNDEGMNDCIRVMIEADNFYSNPQIKGGLRKAARFMMISQLPPPQPGWAQQYNQFLQPAWARSFEPPSVCPSASLNNLNTLMDLALHFNERDYLEPIHDTLAWLDSIRLPNGKWARFVELGTGKPLYYDRGRLRVDSMDELSLERRTGYGYETDLESKLEKTRARFQSLWNEGLDAYRKRQDEPPPESDLAARLEALTPKVEQVIQAQDKKGRWITVNDRYKKRVQGSLWNGEYEEQDRISSQVFINNVNTLCDYLELAEKLKGGK